ncbi:MAG TPA: pyridoxamine 5'-phosphate oxidase family protein [Candidatus Saccharimonadales bacterium]|nr:pyridoxamine 5'-phosphate oxidase family protein [Candidatus Saccharimonadales bacterium]
MFKAKRTYRHPPDRNLGDRQQRMYDFMRENPVGVLSTVGPDGDPHGSVIYYGVDDALTVTFLTRLNTRKFDNLRRQPRVMLTVCDPETQAVLQVRGEAEQVADSEEINAVAARTLGASLHTSEYGLPPISKLEAGPFVGVRIIPKQLRMAVFARPDAGDYSDLFESVESFELPVEP